LKIFRIVTGFILLSVVSAGSAVFTIQNATATSKPTHPIYQKKEFVSQVDGGSDVSAVAYPSSSSRKETVLFVYLHGIGQDCTEPFTVPSEMTIADALRKEFPQLAILSSGYGKNPSWGTRQARADISNNIHTVLQEHHIDHIILGGSTMGACSALLYACSAPKDIREKLLGVIAVYPCADLAELYKLTDTADFKTSMEGALGGKPTENKDTYRQNSLESHLPFFPKHVKVSILSATQDTVVPPKLQKDVERDLKNRDIPVKLISVEGPNQPPPAKSMVEAAHFVLQ
jgi:hypothetical protein